MHLHQIKEINVFWQAADKSGISFLELFCFWHNSDFIFILALSRGGSVKIGLFLGQISCTVSLELKLGPSLKTNVSIKTS